MKKKKIKEIKKEKNGKNEKKNIFLLFRKSKKLESKSSPKIE